MRNTRTLVSVCGVIAMALVLAGCSGGAPALPPVDVSQQEILPPTDSSQQEILPPADSSQQEILAPADVGQQELFPPADAGQQEILPPADSSQQEDKPPASASEQSVPPEIVVEPVTGPASERYAPRTGDGVDVVYFETSKRCACTAKVGEAIEEAVLTYFQDELQSGVLRYFFIVSNDPDNIDLVEMFDSQPLELRIVKVQGGQMTAEPVKEIWSLKNSPSTLVDFVHTLVLSSLEGQQ